MTVESYVLQASQSAIQMLKTDPKIRTFALNLFSELIQQQSHFLIEENRKDIQKYQATLSGQMLSRLKLDQQKLLQICDGIESVAKQTDPLGEVQEIIELDTSLILKKIRSPIGVIAIIFESRPDVIPQILSLILRSGNTVILKGGSEAEYTNLAFMTIVQQVTQKFNELPRHWAQLIHGREQANELLKFHSDIQLVIPRGSNQLVQSIMNNTKIPVLGHADGVCHIYVDKDVDWNQALPVILDAKVQYPSACNAVETILIHSSWLDKIEFKNLIQQLEKNNVQLFGCEILCKQFSNFSSVNDWHWEYGDLQVSLKSIDSIQDAIAHINRYGSHHTDCILSSHVGNCRLFSEQIDSASVMINASTRFADGYRYGKGAEVGISTSKTHARGPVGVEGLLTYKYEVRGQGHIVSDYVGENAKMFTHKKM